MTEQKTTFGAKISQKRRILPRRFRRRRAVSNRWDSRREKREYFASRPKNNDDDRSAASRNGASAAKVWIRFRPAPFRRPRPFVFRDFSTAEARRFPPTPSRENASANGVLKRISGLLNFFEPRRGLAFSFSETRRARVGGVRKAKRRRRKNAVPDFFAKPTARIGKFDVSV